MHTDDDSFCEYCGSDGFIEMDQADDGGEHVTLLEPCPVCSDGVPELIEDGNDTARVELIEFSALVGHCAGDARPTVEVPCLSMAQMVGVRS
jgi:hypothetical protein